MLRSPVTNPRDKCFFTKLEGGVSMSAEYQTQQRSGGGLYLLNKLCFLGKEISRSEHVKRRWEIASWIVYIMGLPFWVYVLAMKDDWIVAAIEAGGLPSMLVGLITTLRGKKKELPVLDRIARITVGLGIAFSVFDVGLMSKNTQWLELGVAAGFLFGTRLLSKKDPRGYYWFLLMNSSNAWLMYEDSLALLMWQQVASFFIIFAVILLRRWRARREVSYE